MARRLKILSKLRKTGGVKGLLGVSGGGSRDKMSARVGAAVGRPVGDAEFNAREMNQSFLVGFVGRRCSDVRRVGAVI